MSTESLNRTSNIEISSDLDPQNQKTPQRVNMDVLKRRIIEKQKKQKLKGKFILLSVCLSLCLVGFLAN